MGQVGQGDGAGLAAADVLPDARHRRPEDAAIRIAVDVDDLHRVADVAVLAQGVVAFEHFIAMEQAAAGIDQVLIDLPGQGVVPEAAPAGELRRRSSCCRRRPARARARAGRTRGLAANGPERHDQQAKQRVALVVFASNSTVTDACRLVAPTTVDGSARLPIDIFRDVGQPLRPRPGPAPRRAAGASSRRPDRPARQSRP